MCDACSANKNVFNCDNVSKAKLNPWYIHYFSKIGLIEFRLEGFLPRFVHRISLQGVQNSFGDNYCLWLRAWSLISWVRVTNEFHSRYCYIYLVERWTDEETFAVMAPETTTDPESRREAGATALANVWPLVGFLVGSLGIVKLRRWLYVQVWFKSESRESWCDACLSGRHRVQVCWRVICSLHKLHYKPSNSLWNAHLDGIGHFINPLLGYNGVLP